jgi:quinolinate synthase
MEFTQEVTRKQKEIRRLKEENDVYIMAHYYQRPEVQAISDVVGDSLELSRKAAGITSSTILFCGVYFMAEVAKMISRKTYARFVKT